MSVRRLSHKGARKKGKRLEYDVAKALVGIGVDAKRVPLSGALSWLKGDVAEFKTAKPHVHECKNCENLQLPSWWRQALSQVADGEIPILHFTSNYKGVFTVLPGDVFDELVIAYEQQCPELTFQLTDFPQRKNFWKFLSGKEAAYHIFSYILDDLDLVIVPFDLYLMLRQQEVRHVGMPHSEFAVA